tara:strand:+ start:1131 stop:1481 length:351 start_codon:yes stop_codon:yes gene_type:complete
MKYSMTLNEALTYHSPVKIYAFMFYAQPGVRDIAILEQGMSIHPTKSFILAEEVTEELAKTYALKRGWFVRFVFPMENYEWDDEIDSSMVQYLSEGMNELKVEHKFLFREEAESNV